MKKEKPIRVQKYVKKLMDENKELSLETLQSKIHNSVESGEVVLKPFKSFGGELNKAIKAFYAKFKGIGVKDLAPKVVKKEDKIQKLSDFAKVVSYKTEESDLVLINKIRIALNEGYLSADTIPQELMRALIIALRNDEEFIPKDIKISSKGIRLLKGKE